MVVLTEFSAQRAAADSPGDGGVAPGRAAQDQAEQLAPLPLGFSRGLRDGGLRDRVPEETVSASRWEVPPGGGRPGPCSLEVLGAAGARRRPAGKGAGSRQAGRPADVM